MNCVQISYKYGSENTFRANMVRVFLYSSILWFAKKSFPDFYCPRIYGMRHFIFPDNYEINLTFYSMDFYGL